jgi:proline dehydrogenase
MHSRGVLHARTFLPVLFVVTGEWMVVEANDRSSVATAMERVRRSDEPHAHLHFVTTSNSWSSSPSGLIYLISLVYNVRAWLGRQAIRHSSGPLRRRRKPLSRAGGGSMGLMRRALLAGSRSAWLRERAVKYTFVRRSVSRFMPGESLEDALVAASALQEQGIGTMLSHLGENLTRTEEADAVARHYYDVLAKIADSRLDAQISVKLTQLGLDLDKEQCYERLAKLVERADSLSNFCWIDMEASIYVDTTLELFRRVRAKSSRVGVCVQAYLRRTAADLESLLPLDPAVRLVKGAYLEAPELVFTSKRDVDENFHALATRFLTATEGRKGLLGVATHDPRLVARMQAFAGEHGIAGDGCEFEMLYGIQRQLQQELVSKGQRLRVLICYGEYWFPWYMRRLAERPANVMFVLRNLVSG